MRKCSVRITLLSLLVGSLVWGHGEEKPGPHGGFIKMPGSFHTELVVDGPRRAKIYLLDFEWKNPTLQDSSVVLTLHGRGRVRANCVQANDHYVCEFSPAVDLGKKGALVLEAVRAKQKGQSVRYELPLTNSLGDKGHGQHH